MRIKDARTAHALTNLRVNHHFKLFVDALTADLEGEREGREYETDDVMIWIKGGRCQKAREILKAIEDAPDTYQALMEDK